MMRCVRSGRRSRSTSGSRPEPPGRPVSSRRGRVEQHAERPAAPTGQPDGSRESAEKALAILRELVDDYPDVLDYRVHLSKAHNNIGRIRALEGRPAEALAAFQRAAEALESLPQRFPNDHYNLACNLALCIPLVGAGKPELTVEDRALRDELTRRAMAALRLSVGAGYANLRQIRNDSDLDSLRSRDDFQLVLMDLAFPTDPFPRP